jgi:hypothetical protein
MVIEKADELLMTVTLHASADDLAFHHVERGEQGGGAMPLVVVGYRPVVVLFIGKPGWVRSSA